MSTPPPIPGSRRSNSATHTTLIVLFIPITAILAIGVIALSGAIHRQITSPVAQEEIAEGKIKSESERERKAQQERDYWASKAKAAPESERRRAVKSVVQNSSWDGSVRQVERWVKDKIADPEAKLSGWSKVVTEEDSGISRVQCDVRARNALGGWVLERWMFTLDKDGNVLLGGSLDDFRKALQTAIEEQ